MNTSTYIANAVPAVTPTINRKPLNKVNPFCCEICNDEIGGYFSVPASVAFAEIDEALDARDAKRSKAKDNAKSLNSA
jgi:hypothetical protein